MSATPTHVVHVLTLEHARALPEIHDELFTHTLRTLQDGTTVRESTPRPFIRRAINGDDIIVFIDVDGRTMKVCQTSDGPAKAELRL